ncbi:MAG TPA: cytochrome c biogenesis protein CcdA [Spirochaetota bacterium]|nr:cytochrome c biogenesis protein CcdA [Spirochaetota bacterium]
MFKLLFKYVFVFTVFICLLPARAQSKLKTDIYKEYTVYPVNATNRLAVKINIPPGHYLYAFSAAKPQQGFADIALVTAGGSDFKVISRKYSRPGIVTDYNGQKKKVYQQHLVVVFQFCCSSASAIPAAVKMKYVLCDAKSCTAFRQTRKINLRFSEKKSLPRQFFQKLVAANTYTTVPLSAAKQDAGIDSEAAVQDPAGFGAVTKELFQAFLKTVKPVPFADKLETGSFLWALLFGFIAGIILNITPCVLPVISIKVLSILKQAGENKKTVKLHALAFTAGMLAVFMLLAFLAAYAGYAWGELFKEPFFLIIMILLVLLMALSLFGLVQVPFFSFAVGSGQSRSPYFASFNKGIFATLLATPCSGPLLGGVLAWALLQKPWIIFIIFMSAGLGMAAPYLLLMLKPALLGRIPRGGKWIYFLEKLFGFMLLATAWYLFYLINYIYYLPLLAFILGSGFLLFIYKNISYIKSRITRLAITVFLVILAGSGFWFSFVYYINFKKTAAANAGNRVWKPFRVNSFFNDLENERKIIVNFTADWCLTCKAVAGRVLYADKVQQYLKQNNISCYTVDLTGKDPFLTSFQRALDSRSIPFVACFRPGSAESRRVLYLRDIFTRATFMDFAAGREN